MDSKKSFAPVILRIGVSLVYLWFGFNQFFSPDLWLSWLPDYASLVPISGHDLVVINGISEIIFGIFILIGFKIRFFAFLLALHALHILTTVGYNAIGVRDFGILMAVLSVFLHGGDRWSLDSKMASKSAISI